MDEGNSRIGNGRSYRQLNRQKEARVLLKKESFEKGGNRRGENAGMQSRCFGSGEVSGTSK